ncbi:hypothetical protein Drose_35930 [Dactylosporangium roseum]|uniref:Uncharacterized protein n=1 Tax=Dactylosporangium roseum TaxID=47989 RepID=A0ABY5Z4H4_9ACTN|nr:hypothetical protein [Dactylosporangium roseum]UWZ36367.1 hypothetical protein Drose_35930 [Dactylosporangium roseum]
MNWDVFAALPGSQQNNFENLARHLIHRHYGSFGDFKALANQPGVEFHLKLREACSLGDAGRWYGWQCKWYDLPPGRAIGNTRKKVIEDGIKKTATHIPGVTDWVLWTKHPLTKDDQDWFYGLDSYGMTLTLWTGHNIEELLAGPGEIYRSTYFGELILTDDALRALHTRAVAPVLFRWLPEAHQPVDAERALLRMLGGKHAREELHGAVTRLRAAQTAINADRAGLPEDLGKSVEPVLAHLEETAVHLSEVTNALAAGDWESLQDLALNVPTLPKDARQLPRRLRARRQPSMSVTNALDDLNQAHELLQVTDRDTQVEIVAITAAAGNGKTHLSAQVTAAEEARPAGVFLRGHGLSARGTLDDLARQVTVNGQPCASMDALIAAVDAAGERARRRLPIIIDGLNEAEDPRVWKTLIAGVKSVLLEYPHVLLVCTLRSTFVEECLPSDTLQVTIDGFAADQESAVARYMEYYKIDPGDADLPEGLLDHPLTLRLFCEVANPDREHVVGVESIPHSLTAVFVRYLEQVAARVAELSPVGHRFYESDVHEGLEKIGLRLWKYKAYGFRVSRLRGLIDNGARWEGSLMRALEQESVLLRDPIGDTGEVGVIVSYDALAGHIIAQAIIATRSRDQMGAWLNDPATVAAFAGDRGDRHPLAEDIFVALAGLLPRLHRRQLWAIVPDEMRIWALTLSAGLESTYLDTPTVEALAEHVRTAPPNSSAIVLRRLRETRASRNHPLNADFLHVTLKAMSVHERDLRWTEWTRKDWRAMARDLRGLEAGWRASPVRTSHDPLRARWAMWTLTSTVRALRDQATRSLYWFGRHDPKALFTMTVESFDINDEYVSERMAAASYGVIMAHQVHDTTIAQALPPFLAALAETLIGPAARHPTSHWLTRLHVHGIFTFAATHYPDSDTAVLDGDGRIAFGAGPAINILADSDPRVQDVRGAMHMDFENYTLGRLLPERGNYDFDDPGYQQVLANVRSAVVELGWSHDKFGAIDAMIAERSYRDADREGNPERYGKKYSWIAFYGHAGALDDRGDLKPRSERLSDLGIDPSFPERPAPLPVAIGDWATPTPATDEEWVILGKVDVSDELMYPAELNTHPGPWVAVGGYLSTKGQTPGRRVWGLLVTALVAPEHVDVIREALQSRPYPGRHWIPEAPEDHYTFAGEIPWHPHFAHIHEDDPQDDPYLGSIQLENQTLVPAEILMHQFGWEGYHSPLNDAGHPLVPSRNLSTAMQLKAEPQTFGQRGPDGTVVALTFSAPSRFEGNLLYIREDTLRSYAAGRTLIGLFWGERLPTPYPHDQPKWLQEARARNAEVWRRVVVRDFTAVQASRRSTRSPRSRSNTPST